MAGLLYTYLFDVSIQIILHFFLKIIKTCHKMWISITNGMNILFFKLVQTLEKIRQIIYPQSDILYLTMDIQI